MFRFYSNSNSNIIGQTISNIKKKNTDMENGIQKKPGSSEVNKKGSLNLMTSRSKFQQTQQHKIADELKIMSFQKGCV